MKTLLLINSETGEETEQHLDDGVFNLLNEIRRRNKIEQSKFWNNVLSQVLFDLNLI